MTRAKNIKQLRIKHNLTQEQLAEKIGVSLWHMNKIENGSKSLTMANALRLTKIFNCSLEDIIER